MRRGETVLIVTSDHGEHLGEHGLADHQASVDDHLVRVPFVIWGPERVPSGTRHGIYEFVDVLSSLSQLLGVELPVPYLEGRRTDLFDMNRRRMSDGLAFGEWRSWGAEDLRRLSKKNPSFDFSQVCRDLVFVRDHRFKLVRQGSGDEALYDLETDPMEETNVYSDHTEVVRRFQGELDMAIQSWQSWAEAGSGLTAQEADEIEEHLSALGYI
jgi:arylsulfatase A-like enzyme